jgi:hypothetical protein
MYSHVRVLFLQSIDSRASLSVTMVCSRTDFHKYVKNRQCTQQETENVIEVLMFQISEGEQLFLIKTKQTRSRILLF